MKTSADFISKECEELHLPSVELLFTPLPACETLLPPAYVCLFKPYLLSQERMQSGALTSVVVINVIFNHLFCFTTAFG